MCCFSYRVDELDPGLWITQDITLQGRLSGEQISCLGDTTMHPYIIPKLLSFVG